MRASLRRRSKRPVRNAGRKAGEYRNPDGRRQLTQHGGTGQKFSRSSIMRSTGNPKRLFAGYIIACNFSVQEANGAVGVHRDVAFVRYKDNRVSAFMKFIKQAHDFAAGG